MDSYVIPMELLSLIGVADELGGALMIYRDDSVAWKNDEARRVHPTLDWTANVTFDDIFHESMRLGRISDRAILSDPVGHLRFAKAARACGQNFQFRRAHGADVFDRYHVGLDSTWNAQIWLNTPKPFADGLTQMAAPVPLELAQAVEQRRTTQQMTAVLEQLGVAMAVVSAEGRLISSSPLMERSLGSSTSFPLTVDAQSRLRAATDEATASLRKAIRSVSRQHEPAALVPVGAQQVAVLAASDAENALVVVQTDTDPGAFARVLMSAYGLNAREAEAVVLLAMGSTPEQIATACDRKIDTVRRQVANAKAKIAADRQHALAHIITRAAALFGGIPLIFNQR